VSSRGRGDREAVNHWPNAGRPVTVASDGSIVNRKALIGGIFLGVGYEVARPPRLRVGYRWRPDRDATLAAPTTGTNEKIAI
jgi:hypothetical protein